jgi:hypothetical protein
MATVYLADDLRHERKVALEVLTLTTAPWLSFPSAAGHPFAH